MDRNSAVFGVFAVASAAAFLIYLVAGPIGRSIGRWIESYGGGGGQADRIREQEARLAELEARIAELEALSQRTAELEERLEFTERLLARARQAEQLGRGGG
jgi:hypothetical protein